MIIKLVVKLDKAFHIYRTSQDAIKLDKAFHIHPSILNTAPIV